MKKKKKKKKWIREDKEMRNFYNSLDLYICASYSEGAPRPVMEAAACGIPVISVDVGIVPEVVENGKTGFIVERTVEAFKTKLIWIAKNRELLCTMGRAAREKMEQEFNWNCIINQWIDFFRHALELYQIKGK